MVSTDTTVEARAVQLAAYRAMTPTERVAIAVALSEDARAVLLAGIASRFPSAAQPEVAAELRRILNRRQTAVRLDRGS